MAAGRVVWDDSSLDATLLDVLDEDIYGQLGLTPPQGTSQQAQSEEAGDPPQRVIEAAAQCLLLGAGAETDGESGDGE